MRRASIAYPGGQKRKAMTLMELMVGMVIFTLISGAVFFLFSISSKYSENVNARLELQQGLLAASSMITDDLMQTGPFALLNLPADGMTRNTVSFRKADAPVAGSKIWSPVLTVYALAGPNNDQLVRTEAGRDTVVCENVTGLWFRRTSAEPEVVEIRIEVQTNTSRAVVSDAKQFAVKMRN